MKRAVIKKSAIYKYHWAYEDCIVDIIAEDGDALTISYRGKGKTSIAVIEKRDIESIN